MEEPSRAAAALLEPVLAEPVVAEHGGRNGRLCVQTHPRYHRDADVLVRQALRVDSLAPNV